MASPNRLRTTPTGALPGPSRSGTAPTTARSSASRTRSSGTVTRQPSKPHPQRFSRLRCSYGPESSPVPGRWGQTPSPGRLTRDGSGAAFAPCSAAAAVSRSFDQKAPPGPATRRSIPGHSASFGGGSGGMCVARRAATRTPGPLLTGGGYRRVEKLSTGATRAAYEALIDCLVVYSTPTKRGRCHSRVSRVSHAVGSLRDATPVSQTTPGSRITHDQVAPPVEFRSPRGSRPARGRLRAGDRGSQCDPNRRLHHGCARRGGQVTAVLSDSPPPSATAGPIAHVAPSGSVSHSHGSRVRISVSGAADFSCVYVSAAALAGCWDVPLPSGVTVEDLDLIEPGRSRRQADRSLHPGGAERHRRRHRTNPADRRLTGAPSPPRPTNSSPPATRHVSGLTASPVDNRTCTGTGDLPRRAAEAPFRAHRSLGRWEARWRIENPAGRARERRSPLVGRRRRRSTLHPMRWRESRSIWPRARARGPPGLRGDPRRARVHLLPRSAYPGDIAAPAGEPGRRVLLRAVRRARPGLGGGVDVDPHRQ